jgi:hypothetical protein
MENAVSQLAKYCPLNVVIKSRRRRLAVHVARTQVKENAWKIVAGKLKEQRQFGKY